LAPSVGNRVSLSLQSMSPQDRLKLGRRDRWLTGIECNCPDAREVKKNKENQARRRSNLGHRADPTRHGVNFHMVTVTRRLPDRDPTVTNGCQSPHTTRYTLNYNNTSFHSDTFFQPYLWPNSSYGRWPPILEWPLFIGH
jgi:hypothetical protein